MTQLHEREDLGFKSIETIEPAQGEEKERLKRDCIEYLQDPDKTSVADFLNYTNNMIQLIGGKREKKENGNIVTLSNPLLDKETDTSIVLKITETEEGGLMPMTRMTITAESPSKTEGLQVFLIPGKEKDDIAYSTYGGLNRKIIRPNFESYITEKEVPEELVLMTGSRDLKPTEAKGFARRIFGVYRRQGQQAQSPTLQS